MGWFTRDRDPGIKGVNLRPYKGRIAVIIDVSGSMCGVFEGLHRELRRVHSIIRDYRLIVFADEAKETNLGNFLSDAKTVGGGTDMFPALELAVSLQPERIVVMSDGMTAGMEKCWELAGQTTAVVHALGSWPEPELAPDSGYCSFMRKLAQCGSGLYCPIHHQAKDGAAYPYNIDPFMVSVPRMQRAMGKTIGYIPNIIEEHHAPKKMADIGSPQRICIGVATHQTKINIRRGRP